MSLLSNLRGALSARKLGKPETRNQKPETAPALSGPLATSSIIRPQVRERWLLPQVGAITPQYIEMTLRGALAGAHVAQWELFNLMEDTWPRLRKNCLELKMAVRNRRPIVEAYREEDEAESPSATDRMKLVSAALRHMAPDPGVDESAFDDMLSDILDAWFKGVSILEIDWHIAQTPRLGQFIAPRCTRWASPVDYAWDGDLRVGLSGIQNGQGQIANGKSPKANGSSRAATSQIRNPKSEILNPFPPDKFLIAKCKTKSGSILGGALFRPLVWWWCAANFSADWLLNLAQIFGLPFRWATYEPTAPQETVDRICAMLQNMGSAGWAAFPSGTTLELRAEGQKSGRDTPQGDMLDRADKQCDLLVLGQTLTTDTGGMGAGGGSHALGQVHATVRDGIIDAAAKFAAGVLEQQLIPAILRLNYGDAEEAPTLCLQALTEDNLQEKAAIIAQLQAAGAGAIIPLDWLGKTFGIPKPEPGEPTLAEAKPGAGPAAPNLPHSAPNPEHPTGDSVAGRYGWREDDALRAMNENHDPQTGRFTSGPGGSAGPSGPAETADTLQKKIDELKRKIARYRVAYFHKQPPAREILRKAMDDAKVELAHLESFIMTPEDLKQREIYRTEIDRLGRIIWEANGILTNKPPAEPEKREALRRTIRDTEPKLAYQESALASLEAAKIEPPPALPRPDPKEFETNFYTEDIPGPTKRERDWVRGYIGGDAFEDIAKAKIAWQRAKTAKEKQAIIDSLNTCALRMSIALNKSGFAIPSGLSHKDFSSYTYEESNSKSKDDNGNPKDAYQKEERHYYISKAKDMDDYLLKTWGKPDLTIEPGDNSSWDSERMKYFQKHLKPGVVAVFARQGHTGIITKTYMDNSAPEVAGPVHIWLLRPK